MVSLAFSKERRKRPAPGGDADERTGVFTTGMVALWGGRQIVLYATGRESAAAEAVREWYFTELRGYSKETSFIVGTILKHGRWMVIGVFCPKKDSATSEGSLFVV